MKRPTFKEVRPILHKMDRLERLTKAEAEMLQLSDYSLLMIDKTNTLRPWTVSEILSADPSELRPTR